jgi:magnesium transporter
VTKRRAHFRVEPGAAPGTLSVDPHAQRPEIGVTAYGPEGLVEERVEDVAQLAGYLERWPVVWVNVDGLGDAEMLQELAAQFELHRLSLEDVVNVGQRAKVEPYDDHLFVVMRMVTSETREHHEQISMFLGKRFVLTFQERAGDCFDPVRQRIREGKGRIRRAGPDYLAYALLDALIDGYFPLLEEIGDRLDVLEGEVFTRPEKDTVTRIQSIKGQLRGIRRTGWPHRDVAVALLRDSEFVAEETKLYLRDCEDHAIQVIDLTDLYREVATDLMGAYLSSVSNRMNEVMKFLTIVASIFIPLSFIAGVYGMNFDPEASAFNMPELGWTFGYPVVLGAMLAVGLGMILYFKIKGWFD